MSYTVEIVMRHDDGSMNQVSKLARRIHPHGETLKAQAAQGNSRVEAVKAAIRLLEAEQAMLEMDE